MYLFIVSVSEYIHHWNCNLWCLLFINGCPWFYPLWLLHYKLSVRLCWQCLGLVKFLPFVLATYIDASFYILPIIIIIFSSKSANIIRSVFICCWSCHFCDEYNINKCSEKGKPSYNIDCWQITYFSYWCVFLFLGVWKKNNFMAVYLCSFYNFSICCVGIRFNCKWSNIFLQLHNAIIMGLFYHSQCLRMDFSLLALRGTVRFIKTWRPSSFEGKTDKSFSDSWLEFNDFQISQYVWMVFQFPLPPQRSAELQNNFENISVSSYI